MTAAAFVDRDGVINELVWDPRHEAHESPYAPGDVRLAPGAAEGLVALRDAGYLVVVVSNQPAAAKERVSPEDLRAVHERVEALLADAGVAADEWRYCFHHPAGTEPVLGVPCDCRKPAPGLLTAAAAAHGIDLAASWMIGDSDTDVQAGRAAGCRTVLVCNPLSAHRRAAGAPAEAGARARDLGEAALLIAGHAVR